MRSANASADSDQSTNIYRRLLWLVIFVRQEARELLVCPVELYWLDILGFMEICSIHG